MLIFFIRKKCSFHYFNRLIHLTWRFFFLLMDVGRHSLLVTSMTGMVQTTRWRRINLVFGQLKLTMSKGNRPSLIIPGLNFALDMVEYGLIEFLCGFVMQLLMPLNLELPMMVFIGILLLLKGLFYCSEPHCKLKQ